MMSGEISHRSQYATDDQPATSRGLGNGRHSPTSPLKLFGQAKKKVNDIFVDIGHYIDETDSFLKGSADDKIIQAENRKQVESYISKVTGIRDMLSRDRMKVAFFGRTSNGKSTVINAMLKDKILPSGIGHTTHCFLQVEGMEVPEPCLFVEDDPTPHSVQSIGQMASAVSSMKLQPNTLIRLCWPKDKCNLLKDDVVLVDSPGIDVSPDLDSWIAKHCLDADVFVLVANAESTLMQTEKNFFHKVSSRLSKPNIFILNNRWDASASEPESIKEVRQQHEDRTVSFLADELQVMDIFEARNRVFFISAKEVLAKRSHDERGTPLGEPLWGFTERFMEFSNFERKFEECISQSAVQTKFAQHTDNGKLIISDVRCIMEDVLSRANQSRDQFHQDYLAKTEQHSFVEKQLNLLTSEIKDKIRQMREEVEVKVSNGMMEEIRRLAILVDEFERPFHPDQMMLSVYKKELHLHVESTLGRNLRARCSAALHGAVESAKEQMTDRLIPLLPDESQSHVMTSVPNKEFEVAYRLDCRNLCADFQEDIEFRFSLGITSLMYRYLGAKGTRQALTGYDAVPRPIAMTPQTPSNEGVRPGHGVHDADAILAALTSFTSLYSSSTIGMLAIGGLVAKSAGWKVIAVCGAVYGLVYVYERLTWTNKAKERAFKRQYVDYAASKLKLIIDLTSANCSHQVEQELSSTFARLAREVDLAKDELNSEIQTLRNELTRTDEIGNNAKTLKNKAGYLDTELNSFIHMFLKPDSRL